MDEILIEKVSLPFRLEKLRDGVRPAKTSVLEHMGFVLGDVLGSGEFSKVFRAKWKKDSKDVALKVISKSNLSKEFLEKNLPTELFVLYKTQAHPLIVDFYGVYETPKSFYLVFEYLPMGNLLDYVNKRKFLGEAESRKFFKQLIDVTDYCHREGIVHGDIKLDNILLDQYFNIRLCDFGFATVLHAENVRSTTDSGSMLYAAPEVYGRKPYDGMRADIWSIGICLYAMLCGRLPFNVPDRDVYLQQVHVKLKFSRLLSRGCRRLIRNLLSVDPGHRPQMYEIRKSSWLSQPIRPDNPDEYAAGNSSPSLISPDESGAGIEELCHGSARKAEARARFVSGVLRTMAAAGHEKLMEPRVLRQDSLLTIGAPEESVPDEKHLAKPWTRPRGEGTVPFLTEEMLQSLNERSKSTVQGELRLLRFTVAGRMARKAIALRKQPITTLEKGLRFKAAVLRVQRELLGDWRVACRHMLTCAATFRKELEEQIEKQDAERNPERKTAFPQITEL